MTDSHQPEVLGHCQLIANAPGAEPLPWYVARRARGLSRRLHRLFARFLRGAAAESAQPSAAAATPGMGCELAPGDWVRVRSRAEIQQTLASGTRRSGCAFLEPMARYCGREFRVARRVGRFFDEARWRMLKCRDTVLLEGVYCDGSGHADTRGCDRLCFFFWRTEWLERIPAPTDQPGSTP
jgi:hypothetical protein